MLSVAIKRVIYACCPSVLEPTLARIEASEIGYRLAKGAFWSITGAVISRGLMLAASIVLARVLGKKGFGELGIIQATVGMLQIFAGFALGLTATKYVAEYRTKDPARAGRVIALSGITTACTAAGIAVMLLVLAPYLSSGILKAPHLTNMLRVGSLMLFLGGINGAQTGALSGFEAFKTIAHVNLAAGLLSFPLMVLGVYWGGLVGAVWGLNASLAANWVVNHFALRKEARLAGVPLRLRGCWQEREILVTFSLPSVLGGIVLAPVTWVCSAILVRQENGFSEMGIFNAANQWRTAILFLPGILGQVALPLLTNLYGEGKHSEYHKVLRHNIYISGAVTLLAATILSAGSWFIMGIYGEGFAIGYPVLILLSISAVLMAINNVIGQVIASMGKMWAGFALNLLWASVLIFCTWIWRTLGAVGFGLATLVSYCFHSATCSVFAYKYLRLQDVIISRPTSTP